MKRQPFRLQFLLVLGFTCISLTSSALQERFDVFFGFSYPELNNTPINLLDSTETEDRFRKPMHCGICHEDFQGGEGNGNLNLFGELMNEYVMRYPLVEAYPNAIYDVDNLGDSIAIGGNGEDVDGDGFSNAEELFGNYPNTPTFPGWSADNILKSDQWNDPAFAAEIVAYLTPLGDPPSDEEPELVLGEMLYSDENLSLNRNQSCASCHSLDAATVPLSGQPFQAPGFVDPDNVESNTPVSEGSVAGQAGSLNSPSAAYAAFSPDFHWSSEKDGYVGGQFWNGRAKNLEAQAEGPFLNPVEMAMPSEWAVITRIKENATYVQLFDEVYGIDLDEVPASELAPSTNEPPQAVQDAYGAMAQAIGQFERTRRFSPFTSKFDFWQAGMTELTTSEINGFNLFTGIALCSECHSTDSTLDLNGHAVPPLFTDFTYDNLGLPRNLNIPRNPEPDLGLGGRADIAELFPNGEQDGKHKAMTLRNIEITAPYGHNGVFSSLEDIVHFYNTRDILGHVNANTNAMFGVTGWPDPEVARNVNALQMGNLGLTTRQEADLVAFMKTLSDGYPESGEDPTVPPGTPSPYADSLIPTLPVVLAMDGGSIAVKGRIGKHYSLEYTDALAGTNNWQLLSTKRLTRQGMTTPDTNSVSNVRFFRAKQLD